MAPLPWSIPREWSGETAFLLGGGLSLSGFDTGILRGRGRVLAINEAGLTLAPWADVFFHPDPRWLEWNVDRYHLNESAVRLTRQDPAKRTPNCTRAVLDRVERLVADTDVKFVSRETVKPLSQDPRTVAGVCGGGNAINIAYHFGSTRIVLLGYDMKPNGNFHDRHKKQAAPSNYDRFRTAIIKMGVVLSKFGVQVLNATPDSALTCFPAVELKDVL